MIAHRLQTIETAENLLYIDNPKKIIPAQKGTPEYDEIINRLKTETYKHQDNGTEVAGDGKNYDSTKTNGIKLEMSPDKYHTADKSNMHDYSSSKPFLKNDDENILSSNQKQD